MLVVDARECAGVEPWSACVDICREGSSSNPQMIRRLTELLTQRAHLLRTGENDTPPQHTMRGRPASHLGC